MTGTLYASGWSPKGAARAWGRTSMPAESARPWLTRIVTPRGLLTEAVGWFDPAGGLRILVCDFDSGMRLTVRLTTRGLSATIGRTPPARRRSGFRQQGSC